MAAKTLNQLVRDQILAEANQITDPDWRERYVDTILCNMSNVELLERISAAVEKLTQYADPRQWL